MCYVIRLHAVCHVNIPEREMIEELFSIALSFLPVDLAQ